jgi:hypothetical protein
MVKGLDKFLKHFKGQESAYVLIGGTACDIWMSDNPISFRPTKDLDMVLIVEALSPDFIRLFWKFVSDGHYEINQNSAGQPRFYRFLKPKEAGYPTMIELFSRNNLELPEGVRCTPIPVGDDLSSLSALLLNDDYYHYIQTCRIIKDDCPIVPAHCLIPLKARAYLDLRHRKDEGAESIDEGDIKKHRNDVFRLFQTLIPSERHTLPDLPRTDLASFLSQFPATSPEWSAIANSIKPAILPDPNTVLTQMRAIFQLQENDTVTNT